MQHIAQTKACRSYVASTINQKQLQMAMSSAYGNRPTTRSTAAALSEVAQGGDYEGMHLPSDGEESAEETQPSVGTEESTTPSYQSITYTNDQYHETKLLQLLDSIKAPHYMYGEILKWGREAKMDKYSFFPKDSKVC